MKAGIGMGELETRDETAVRVLVTDARTGEPAQEGWEFRAGRGFQAPKRSITQRGVQLDTWRREGRVGVASGATGCRYPCKKRFSVTFRGR